MVYHRAITYVFFFLARLKYPVQVSIAKILQRRYGDALVKEAKKNLRNLILDRENFTGSGISTVMQERQTHSEILTV